MIIASSLLIIVYVLLIAFYFLKWNSLTSFSDYQNSFSTTVSIVVAVRNEENSLPELLSCLQNQSYPHSLFEIILVNDHSNDRTLEVIANSFLHSTIKHLVVSLNPNQTGKKTAIAQGVESATGELILTTDADCSMGSKWISAIVSFYKKNNPDMMVMPVLQKEKSFTDSMQAMEFLSLTATTASSLAAGRPLMCNGANLAYKKNVFMGAYTSNQNIPTGDDTFLLFYLYDTCKSNVLYLKSKEVLVKTRAEKTFASYIHQRIRWASKIKKYNNYYVVLVGLLIFMLSVLQLTILVIFPFFYSLKFELVAICILFFPKMLMDFFYLKNVAGYFSEKIRLPVFFVWQFVYPFYIIAISFLSLFAKYKWKGRKY